MSAECSKCGYDLPFMMDCAYCEMEQRAEQAESERDTLRTQLHAAQEALEIIAKSDFTEGCPAIAREALRRLS